MAFEDKHLEVCKHWKEPGIGADADRYVDYSKQEATVDQKRIIEQLKTRINVDTKLLHVGVGDSSFAQELSAKVHLIDGITVNTNEYCFARDKNISNYTVYQFSKHSREFVLQLENKYDYIVDNNPASFTCCRYHFYLMLDNYLWALKPGGCILTDEIGIGWSCCDSDFVLNYQQLLSLQERLPINVTKLTDSVISVTENNNIPERPLLKKSFRLCHKENKEVIEPRFV